MANVKIRCKFAYIRHKNRLKIKLKKVKLGIKSINIVELVKIVILAYIAHKL